MTTPTREQVEALCADLDEHTEDERGYCDRCMFRWPCGAVETREALRALLAETDSLRQRLQYSLGELDRRKAEADAFALRERRQAAELREAHTRTEEIRVTLAEVVTGEWDTPTMAVLAVAEVKRMREDKARACQWTFFNPRESDEDYETGCGMLWSFTSGALAENDTHFCPKCGGRIIPPKPPAPDEDDDVDAARREGGA